MSDFKYSIQLRFEKKTEDSIKMLIEHLRSKNLVNEKYINENYTPHISLGVFKSMDECFGSKMINGISKDFSKLNLNLNSLGHFYKDLKVLYFSPTLTTELRNIHLRMLKDLKGRPEENWDLYNLNNWIPHCAILIDDNNTKIIEALNFVFDFNIGDIQMDRIQLTGFKDKYIFELSNHNVN